MAFGTGAILTVWGVARRGNYLEVECSSSRKNPNTGNYETDFSSKFVKFVGKAANMGLKERDKIKLINCSVQNVYEKNGQRIYTKNPQYTVFEFEYADANGSSNPNGGSYVPSEYAGNGNPLSNFEEIPTDTSLPF